MEQKLDYVGIVDSLTSKLLKEEIVVPDGLAWHIEQYKLNLQGEDRSEPNGFLNVVGLNYDDSSLITVKKDDLSAYLKQGRNDACHCNSGKKYKQCHAPEELPKLIAMIENCNAIKQV